LSRLDRLDVAGHVSRDGDGRGRHRIGRLEDEHDVVLAEAIIKIEEFPAAALHERPERLLAILRVLDHRGPRLRCVTGLNHKKTSQETAA